ncbi:MAG: DNA-processing protein DprA [Prevotella sp.]|nr:DNA-processing protein DprA [Prevotella sp.]
MDYNETLNAMTLARLSYYSLASIHLLYRQAGSATAVIDNIDNIRDILPDASERLVEILRDCRRMRSRAEEELDYDLSHGVKPLDMSSSEYPHRLLECDDAPLVIYYKGNANLNASRVINIVGTRRCTPYGQDLIRSFVADMATLCPGVLVVSGLAYGIDVCAHSQALERGLSTIGVLAHGLDDLYPTPHRAIASKMVEQGGLLTEFMTRTKSDKINFVRRNRIVAGMSDACILVESAAHGGGLITAEIARGYNRDVFAFPGRVGDEFSEGCNNLIRDNGAALLTDAEHFVKAMGWEGDASLAKARSEGIERTIFPNLSPEEATVVETLAQRGDLHLNMLATQTGIAVNRLTSVLFELEMKGLLRNMAGGMYHLMPMR